MHQLVPKLWPFCPHFLLVPIHFVWLYANLTTILTCHHYLHNHCNQYYHECHLTCGQHHDHTRSMSTPLRSLHSPNWKLENVFFSISTDFSQISIFYFYGSGIGLILLFLQFTCLQPHLLLNQIGFVKSVNLKIQCYFYNATEGQGT